MHFLVTISFSPLMALNNVFFTAAISEHPIDFLLRRMEINKDRGRDAVLLSEEIGLEDYKKLRPMNPKGSGLLEQDWGDE